MRLGICTGDGVNLAPPYGVEAIEFGSFDRNRSVAGTIARSLRGQGISRVSCHLLPLSSVALQAEEARVFQVGDVDAFICHVTKQTPFERWREYLKTPSGTDVLLENHNEDWHPTNAGWCWPEQFREFADSGGLMCLDTGHILMCCTEPERGTQWDPALLGSPEWEDRIEKTLEGFLRYPIAQVHAHTVNLSHGYGPAGTLSDHCIAGWDIGPWLKRIVKKNPDVTLLVECMDPRVNDVAKFEALKRWVA